MMKLSELQAGQGSVNVSVVVKSKGDVRTFNKYGKDLSVCNFVVSDESGEIKLSLWNADIDKVKVGDMIQIENGYVSAFNGEKQLTTGKFGKLIVGGSSGGSGDSGSSGSESLGDSGSGSGTKPKKKAKKDEIEEEEF
ncbi:MAG TPA: SOSS complex subunit B family protein [Candidatus Nanoarchaeia archaeon]|nr:SOSS complex subunit B family protein [Candidatus Nanoarchaeia archaeon]